MPHYSLLSFLLLFIFIHPYKAYHVSGNVFYDLEETTIAGLTAELTSWTYTATFTSTLVTSCWGYYVVGGYGVLQSGYGYWQRTYSIPQTHNGLHVTMRFFQIDSWDAGNSDRFYLYMDGYTVPGWILTPSAAYGGGDGCGTTFTEMAPMMVYAQIPHSGNTFTFTVQSYLDSNSYDESLGFRDIVINLYDTNPALLFGYCGRTNGNALSYAWCGCAINQYAPIPQSGICANCDPGCATCSGSASTCYSCNAGWFLVGTTCTACSTNCLTCDTTATTCRSCNTGWFMVGTTCYPTCKSPLYTGVVNGVTYCYTPCPGSYVYWDGSCSSWCGYDWGYWSFYLQPSIESTYYRCDYPCYGTGQYLYWNNSCLNSCPEPLTTVSYRNRNLCSYPCAATEWLYWNKSCIADCPYPLSSETQGYPIERKFCWYTCQPGDFLYYNRSCIGTCPYPLSPESQGTPIRKFCWYACMPWQWLNWDQTCQDSCVAPLWPETHGTPARHFCWYPCTSEARFLYWNGTCLPECPEPLKTRYQNGQWFCDYPCSPTTQWLYWNGSCIGNCVSPLLSKIEGSPARRFCYYPCPIDKFAYWDNTCQSSCDFPLVPNSEGNPIRQFCWYLCPTNQYLYWNGSCIGQCNFPLKPPRITNGRNFCDYPCLVNQYLFWNGSCLASCPNPLTVRVEGIQMKRSFCDFLCDPTKYLYWNGSCLDTCSFPLSTRNEGSGTYLRKFCDYPCNGNQYLYWNGSCMNKCVLPLIVRIHVDKRYCDYLCPPTQAIYWDGTCGPTCNPPLIQYSQGSPSRKYCKYPCQNGQFLNPNGTCFDNCAFPLTSSVVHSQLLCHYPCSTSQYLFWNGSCLNSCDFPFSKRIENSNSWKYCDFPCQSSQYLYWNGTCNETCKFPLTPRITDNNLYCDFTCPISTDFLYWNGTCDSDCPFPLTSTQEGSVLTRKYCASKCPTQYLYWNGSCHDMCNFPLSTRTNNGTYFCDYPCLFTEFLYWNATCSDSCIFPLSTRIDAGNNYCDKPCKYDEEYVYWNGTCSALCKFPLQTRNDSNMLYCDYPCDPLTELLFFTGICITDCSIPHQIRVEGDTMLRNFCMNNCSSDEYLYWNGSCREVCESPRRTIYNNTIRYCEKPCENITDYYHETLETCKPTCEYPNYNFSHVDYNACTTSNHWKLAERYSYFDMFLHAPLKDNTLTVVHLVKSMQYVRYIDIKMSPRLERLANSKGRQILSIKSGITMWSDLLSKFTMQVLPDAYHRLRVHSSFLVNYWEDLSLILIAFLLALASFCMERLARGLKIEKAEVIFQTLRVVTKWNFVIIITAININDLILYTTLEIKSWDPNNSASTASFISSIGAILAILAFFGVICYFASQGPSWNRPMTSSKESYQVLFMPFRQDNKLARFFFPIYMLRIAIPTLIAISAERVPILNTIMQLVFSIGVVTLIVCIKPFNKKINYVQLVTFETAILVMNLFMVVISLLSENSKENYKVAVFLGDLVILSNDFINLMNLVFLIIKLHAEIKLIRQYTARKVVTGNQVIGLWVQLLYVPIQQANMGFEEMTAFPTRVHLSRPQPRPHLEESEISIKKNASETAFNEAETNNFLSAKEAEVSFCQDETNIENNSPLDEDREEVRFTPRDPERTPLEHRPSQNKQPKAKILKSPKPPTLLINGMGVGISPEYSPVFQIEPLTFDKSATVGFSLAYNYITAPRNKEGDVENKTQRRSVKLDDTLDLGDDALFSKIQEDLAELDNTVGEQNEGRKKVSFSYLKKNEGVNRKGYSSNPS